MIAGWRLVFLTLIASLLSVVPISNDTVRPRSLRTISTRDNFFPCGTIALTTLLQLEGKALRPEEVDELLGGSSRNEHSMAEIARVSFLLDQKLTGIYLSNQDIVPIRPFIAHFKSNSDGHYAVIRPLRHRTTIVQIIDPILGNEIVDFSVLTQREDWSGFVLVQPQD